jgi:hypothetical protein
MPRNLSTILLIDPDETAARELAVLLNARSGPPRLFVAAGVSAAEFILRTEVIDWLFIRIIVWDDYQQLVSSLPSRPRRVVFLSGRNEKCTAHLASAVDGHLQPPYRNGHLIRVWNRLSDPQFVPRPLDIFFVKTRARFEPVRYGDLRQVVLERGLEVQTRFEDYRISGSLQAFQSRLPIPLILIRRGVLVNEGFVPGSSVFSSVPARWLR